MEKAFSDIFIIGGGINGAGIAADAAGRGLSVTLCEKSDLGSATSSASSKLIHGGLRYLTTYDFSLVRKALKEREILLKKAPHLIRPLEFILPYAKHLRPRWLVRLGLFIYDHLARHPNLPRSKKINLKNNSRGNPLQDEFKIGFSYYDCYDDDARLVIANAIAAKENGATILTHTTCLSAEYINNQWKITVKNQAGTSVYYAKVLINAAGPWIQSVQKNIHVDNPIQVELVKGSHIILPKLYEGNHAYILQNPDERVVFAIPYENEFTLIGTTDVPYTDSLDKVSSTAEEEKYLCNVINHYFKKFISPQDVVWSYAGVRCLQNDDADEAAKITRDYKFSLKKNAALITVISGKITTYRRLAEEIVDSLKIFFPKIKSSWTAKKPLPGGDIPHHNFNAYVKNLSATFSWLPENILYRYARCYGTRIHLLLQNINSMNDLGEHIGAGLYQREVDYLVQNEWAKTSEDILWRRTKLGLYFTSKEIETLDHSLSAQK